MMQDTRGTCWYARSAPAPGLCPPWLARRAQIPSRASESASVLHANKRQRLARAQLCYKAPASLMITHRGYRCLVLKRLQEFDRRRKGAGVEARIGIEKQR